MHKKDSRDGEYHEHQHKSSGRHQRSVEAPNRAQSPAVPEKTEDGNKLLAGYEPVRSIETVFRLGA